MGREKKKGDSGLATTYYSRSQAMRKLEISMPEFRRLCIFKGIYPQEPRHRRKVNKGSSTYKTYYYRKDIKWLAHEPLLQKGRDFKIFLKKLKKALNNDDKVKTASLEEHHPMYTLDRIVKERYPTFIDALRDIDDALTLTTLYASLSSQKTKAVVSQHCRRLLVEFMHYVITSRSLRKVFISIKGIYYQAEIEGQTITWLTPHQFTQTIPRDVDFRVMNTFIEFYSTLLSFVNYCLFHSLNIRYPPQIEGLTAPESAQQLPSLLVNPNDIEWEEDGDRGEYREVLESFSQSLARVIDPQTETEETTEEEIPIDLDPEEQALRDKAKEEQIKIDLFKKLFEGCRFFLSRETPRESLAFVIRCFGGDVSWDSTCGGGATYMESDDTITHQVVDRPAQSHCFLSRIYIQPQWVYDCINFQRLLPTDLYAPGAVLPPHLSPFAREGEGDYIPPDKSTFLEGTASKDTEIIERSLENKEEDISDKEDDEDKTQEQPPPKRRKMQDPSRLPVGTVVAGGGEESEGEDKNEEKKKIEMEAKEAREERKLAVMMMTRKRRKLYDRIMEKRTKKSARVKQLQQRRQDYEATLKRTT